MGLSNKQTTLLCIITNFGCVGLFAWLISLGVDMLADIDDYAKNGTEEQCYVLDVTDVACSCGKQCIGQKKYSYTALSFDKCGNITLYSEYDQCTTEDPAKIDNEYTCWINDCQDQQFTFNTTEENETAAWTLIILAGLFLLCFGVGGFYFCYLLCCDDTDKEIQDAIKSIDKFKNKHTLGLEMYDTVNIGGRRF